MTLTQYLMSLIHFRACVNPPMATKFPKITINSPPLANIPINIENLLSNIENHPHPIKYGVPIKHAFKDPYPIFDAHDPF